MWITVLHKGRHTTRRFRPLLAACAIAVGVHIFPGAAPVAHASIGPCASDPLFLFSNGTELDVDTLIDATNADIQQVTFTVHVPVGTSTVLYVAGALGSRESWQVVADSPPGSYTTIARVSSAVSNVGVQATTQIAGLISVAATVINGETNQNLTAHLTTS